MIIVHFGALVEHDSAANLHDRDRAIVLRSTAVPSRCFNRKTCRCVEGKLYYTRIYKLKSLALHLHSAPIPYHCSPTRALPDLAILSFASISPSLSSPSPRSPNL